MATKKKVETSATVRLGQFVENPDNPSVASDEDIDRLAGKLRRVPLGLTAMRIAFVTDSDTVPKGKRMVISGNKRLRVLKQAYGEDGEVPSEWFADVTAMSEAERHEFIVTANVSDGEWDVDRLLAQYDRAELGEMMKADEIAELLEYVEKTPALSIVDGDGSFEEGDGAEYGDFVDKFKAKHTTDDCYTPPNIYEAVMKWACARYGINPRDIVRPFKPSGDYQAEKYAKDSVVLDNPPFSILCEICKWYQEHGVKFFLFCPALTPFTASGAFNTVICGLSIVYANGAKVATSFITNMGEYLIETAPGLFDELKAINRENEHKITKDLPNYKYPDCVITAAAITYLNIHHTDFKLKREDAVFIRCLDEQKEKGAGLYGGGFLLSERAAAERAAAERAAAERAAAHEWKLSEREIKIQKAIGK